MIISNLQYIESVTETEVLGGWGEEYIPPKRKKSRPCNEAGAKAAAQAFGSSTTTSTATDTLAIQGQFSGSSSSSFAAAS